MRQDSSPVDTLLEWLASVELDPLGFVLGAFPWGEEGTALEHEPGPEQWQLDALGRMSADLQAGGDEGAVIREHFAAGHGVGKSAFVGWLILWAVSTKAHTRGVVTANTDIQLRTKTWAELGKWYSLFLAKELFKFTATAILAGNEKDAKTWRIDQIPWSDTNTEAFAGMHNKGRRILLIFDEGSAIDDRIYEVAEGALTDAKTQILWAVFGNPTRTSGRFYEIMSGQRLAWRTHSIDSRSVRFSNKQLISQWEEEYGEDSDFFRVRVRGMAPRAGVTNFISPEVVARARRRELRPADYQIYPVVISVDPARFGDDKSVITVRQGPKMHEQVKLQGMDTIELCNRVTDVWRKYPNAVAVVVEVVGLAGSGHVDVLRRVPGMPVTEFNPSAIREQDSPYLNLRAECWGRMRDWLETAELLDDDELAKELTDIEFGYTPRMKIQLESKKDLKSRTGGRSPDCADSLAASFVADILIRGRSVRVQARPVSQRKIVWNQHA